MTKREWDKLTRVNFGERMASDEREYYRVERCILPNWYGRDWIASRACDVARLRSYGVIKAALELGSAWRMRTLMRLGFSPLAMERWLDPDRVIEPMLGYR